MARSQARIMVSVWDDADFTDMPPSAQRLYFFLLSQRNLNHAGMLPLTIRRWTRSSAGLTADLIHNDLEVLTDARFVIVDYDTEELLIRTLVRNDGIWKQPKMLGSMKADATEIASEELRAALRFELERIDPACIENQATREAIEAALGAAITDLPEAPRLPDPTPIAGVSDTHAEAPVEGPNEAPVDGGPDGPYACAGAQPLAPSPYPLTPNHLPLAPDPVPPTIPLPAGRDPAQRDPRVQVLVGEYVKSCEQRPPTTVLNQLGRQIRSLLADGMTAESILGGLSIVRERSLHPSTLPSAVDQHMNARPQQTTSRNRSVLDAAMERARAAEESHPQRKAIGE